MKRIACTTLGCKVNEYDTQAMRELFVSAGWESVPFSQEADVYLINTCTVTSTGDSKSMKMIRRTAREHPAADIIVAGCLAQKDAQRVCIEGVRLVIGSARRGEVVALYEDAVEKHICLNAVSSLQHLPFEPLQVQGHTDKTRAVMKIQEGCDRYCTYCIIPYVRGPVRSLPITNIRDEARRLGHAGYKEIVLTGIHLASYGRGTQETLADAIDTVAAEESIARVRLGSLEPLLIDEAFLQRTLLQKKLCPQFHIALQSGSAGVLSRMHRRYSPQQYANACRLLREAYPGCAITTDVIAGFPGETDEEFAQTEAFLQEIGFARIHVFPYSRRAGTVADKMPGQLSDTVKQQRARKLIAIGNSMEEAYVQSIVGKQEEVLFETMTDEGLCEGFTKTYVRVQAKAQPGAMETVQIDSAQGKLAKGTVLPHR